MIDEIGIGGQTFARITSIITVSEGKSENRSRPYGQLMRGYLCAQDLPDALHP